MLHAVMLGSGPGRGRREWYPGFYLQSRRLGCRMNRGEQENLFRQSRQIIVPSHEDLVLSVLKSPISQQQQQQQQLQQQRQQHRPPHSYQSHGQGHFNCQAHPNNKKCFRSGISEAVCSRASHLSSPSTFNSPVVPVLRLSHDLQPQTRRT